MLTRSGRLVLPGNDQAPTLRDIARGLGRMPRFAGQTRGWWSVLHHVVLVDCLVSLRAAKEGERPSPRFRLLALLHDAHEAITGDVPTPWKRAVTRADQRMLDHRIFQALGVPYPLLTEQALLKEFDREALILEANDLGPRGFFAAEPELGAVAETMEFPLRNWVRILQTAYPMQDTINDDGALVKWYVAEVRRLAAACSR